MSSDYAGTEQLRRIVVGARVSNFMVGLDEASTLHVLKLFNEKRKQHKFLIDLFKDLEFSDSKEFAKTSYEEDSSALEVMYDAEDEVTRIMWDFISTNELENLISKDKS